MAEQIIAEYKLKVQEALKDLNRLQTEFRNTEDASKKAGKAASDSFVEGSNGAKRFERELNRQPKTLAEMELKLRNLRELLRDDTRIGTEGFKKVRAEIDKTEKEVQKLNGGLKTTGKEAGFLSKGFKQLGGMIAAAFAIDRIVDFTKEAVALAAQAEGVERAFRELNRPDLLSDLRSATRGTVTDLELMKRAVQANNFKIPLDQLAKYFEFATNRSIQTGESVDDLTNRIVIGIGRKSVRVLDDLGFSLQELQDEVSLVGDFGEAVGNIIEREMSNMGVVADTTSVKMARLTATWENFKKEVGDTAIVFADLIMKFDDFNQIANRSNNALDRQVKQTANAAISVAKLSAATGEEIGLMQQTRILLFGLTDAEEELIYQYEQSLKAKKEIEEQDKEQIRNIFFLRNEIADLQAEREKEGVSIERILEIKKELKPLEDELNRLLKDQKGKVNDLNISWKEYLKMLEEIPIKEAKTKFEDYYFTVQDGYVVVRTMQDTLKGLNELLSEQKKILETSPEFSKQYKDAEKAIESLEKKIKEFNDNYIDPSEGNPDFAPGGSMSATGQGLLSDDALGTPDLDEIAKALEDAFTLWQNFFTAINDLQRQRNQQELQSLDAKLAAEEITREEYEQKRREILRRQAAQEKTNAIIQATINTALAVTAALNTQPFLPLGPIAAAIAAASGAAQIAAIASQPLPQFAKGVIDLKGEGTETSDSIHAKLSRGESVMTAKETRKYKDELMAIRNGTFENLILSKYVKPMVDESLLNGFKDMGRSAELNGITANLKDHNILAGLDRLRQSQSQGFRFLAQELKVKNQKRGGYRA